MFLRRQVNDIFVNGYSKVIMNLHNANHDVQIVVDPYTVGQYILGYVTKSESGKSRLLKAVNDETKSLKEMDRINTFNHIYSCSKKNHHQ